MPQNPPRKAETEDLAEAVQEALGGGPVELSRQLDRLRRDNERLFQQLMEDERRVRRLARAVWRVQEDERRRIAGELHDGLGQTLTAMKIQLERLVQRHGEKLPELADDLQQAADAALSALNEARRLSHRLRPAVLDDLGLAAALRWLTRTLQEQTGCRVVLDCDTVGEERFDGDLETALFRVVQEAMSNALKHAAADEVKILLEHRPGRRTLFLRVADDGRGFEPQAVLAGQAKGAGFGLRGIRDRIELLGGFYRLRSHPGEGTSVEVELSYHEPERKESL